MKDLELTMYTTSAHKHSMWVKGLVFSAIHILFNCKVTSFVTGTEVTGATSTLSTML